MVGRARAAPAPRRTRKVEAIMSAKTRVVNKDRGFPVTNNKVENRKKEPKRWWWKVESEQREDKSVGRLLKWHRTPVRCFAAVLSKGRNSLGKIQGTRFIRFYHRGKIDLIDGHTVCVCHLCSLTSSTHNG